MWWAAFLIVAMIMQIIFTWMWHTGHVVAVDWIGLYTIFVAVALVGAVITYAMQPVPMWALCLIAAYILLGVITCQSFKFN